MGVHISFVRSLNLDSWTDIQLRMMSLGGNSNLFDFFQKYNLNGEDFKF